LSSTTSWFFGKGYGFRDYEKKLPITANTLFPIASNTKLFYGRRGPDFWLKKEN